MSAKPNPIPPGENKTKLCFGGASLDLNSCVIKRQSDGVTIRYSTEKNIIGQVVSCGWSTQVQPTETYTVKCDCVANAPPEGYVTSSVIVKKIKDYCSVTATADPNPIPEGQNQTTISATDLSHTSLDKCRARTKSGRGLSPYVIYNLPHTYIQDESSDTYVVNCTGDTEYGDCQSEITVTKGNIPPTIPPTVPPTIPPSLTCQIYSFTLNDKNNSIQDPLIVWVNTNITGSFSVSDACKTCTVSSNDTWGNPPSTYSISTDSSSYTESFKISAAGTYYFTLECKDEADNSVIDNISLKTVRAMNLPWWREVIPNLQGFLRGLFR